MNIFVLDIDPHTAAKYHCDKHVVKMVLETAQLLSTAHHIHGTWVAPMYKPTHIHHPCTKWVAESDENYWWTYQLFTALCDQYTYRYKRAHKTAVLLYDVLSPTVRQIQLGTPFVLAMPDKYKVACPVTSYRNYYIGDKQSIATWKYTDTPHWWEVT